MIRIPVCRRRGRPPRAVRPAYAWKSANDPGARPGTGQPFRTSPAPGIQPSRRDGREGRKSMNGAVRLRVTEKAGDRPRRLHVRNPALRQPGRNRRTFPNAWRRRPALEAAWPPAFRPSWPSPAAQGSLMAHPACGIPRQRRRGAFGSTLPSAAVSVPRACRRSRCAAANRLRPPPVPPYAVIGPPVP